MAQVDLVDTIARVAGVGTRLSIALYTFSETVAITTTPSASSASSSSSSSSTIASSASYTARDLARDVSLTCSVLAELRANLKPQDHDHDDNHQSHDNGKAKLDSNADADADSDSDATLKIAKEIVVECGTLFRDMDALVARAVESSSSSKGAVIREMDHLGGNLDRIKSTLLMMLSDLLNAGDSTDEKETPSKEHDGDDDNASQRTLLGNMLRANEEARRNHPPALNATGSRDGTSANARPGDSTIQSCLRHIGNALLRFEHTSSATQHPSRVRVRIELEKVFGPSRYQPGRPNPWVVRSIVRSTAHPRPEYAAAPSNPEPDMYSSVAAGALESLNIEDYDEPQYYSRAPAYRSDGAGRGPGLPREAQQPLVGLSERGQGQRRSSQKPWYSSVWESLPSPTTAMGSIQETIKKTSLLFGADEGSEDSDPGVRRNQPRVGQAVPPQILERDSAKITRSPTFDDILLSPSNKGRSTPPPAANINLEKATDSDSRPAHSKTAEEPSKEDSPDLSAPVASTAEPSKDAADSSVDNPAGKESAEQKDLDTVYQPPKP
ncbi:hypothetical protein AYO20_09830 [Fonsecaea nubica]|uniref:Fungal N-terminal domain-containing protein n=1 Tax=Fonsecaea nubica TaxID=856822 RepID=A0A178CDX4_9EURO|nr:hypothetical protein AYO20_09830 [Fonsecaea nubica]OAL27232.1 hypothetical protein AYO20_09830 [Fonsecaea nubica]